VAALGRAFPAAARGLPLALPGAFLGPEPGASTLLKWDGSRTRARVDDRLSDGAPRSQGARTRGRLTRSRAAPILDGHEPRSRRSPHARRDALDVLFRKARTHRAWLDRPVPDDLLRRVYELAAEGPTSANCSPMRVLFVKSREAKERLRPALTPGNVDKTMQAPVTAIIGHDLEFYEQLPRLFPTPTCGCTSWASRS